MASSALIKAIAATAELCGKVYAPAAASLFASDLDGYDEDSVLAALTRCRKELDGRPFNVAAVIARLDDGRPGVEEAWSMIPTGEEATVVWTEEMCKAWGVAYPLLQEGDKIAARMAFKEVYARAVTEARDQKIRTKWTASLGHDTHGRESILMDAVQKGRLSAPHVKLMLPLHEISDQMLALLERVEIKRIGAE